MSILTFSWLSLFAFFNSSVHASDSSIFFWRGTDTQEIIRATDDQIQVSPPSEVAGILMTAEDNAEMKKRACTVPFVMTRNSLCKCADGLIKSFKEEKGKVDGDDVLLADDNWRLIKDIKHDTKEGPPGIQFTAFSMDARLMTINDLTKSKLTMLHDVEDQGKKEVVKWAKANMPNQKLDNSQITVFATFPPEIFRLHLHFVFGKKVEDTVKWSGGHSEQIVLFEEIVALIERGSKKQTPNPQKCNSWEEATAAEEGKTAVEQISTDTSGKSKSQKSSTQQPTLLWTILLSSALSGMVQLHHV